MKNKLFKIITPAILFFLPAISLAADKCGVGANGTDDKLAGMFSVHFCNVNDLIFQGIQIIMSVLAMVAVLFVVIGGFKYITSNGEEKQATAGRQTMTYALIGLVIAILAYTIVAVVKNAVTDNTVASGQNGSGSGSGGGTTGTTLCSLTSGSLSASLSPTTIGASDTSNVNIASSGNANVDSGSCDGKISEYLEVTQSTGSTNSYKRLSSATTKFTKSISLNAGDVMSLFNNQAGDYIIRLKIDGDASSSAFVAMPLTIQSGAGAPADNGCPTDSICTQ